MADTEKIIEIEVLRYRPEQDKEPVLQSYKVPFTDDMSVLQGVQYIKDYLDGTVSFPLVLPHGDLRQLRHDDRRQAQAFVQDLPARLLSAGACGSRRWRTCRSSAT